MYYIRADYDNTGEWAWIHYPNDEDCIAWDKKLKLALNDAGTLELTYAKTHPAFGRVVARRTIIEVLNDKESLFIGEVREIDHDKMYNETLYAVGALAWLENSIQGQEEFKNVSIRQFLSRLIGDHNKQCPEHPFVLGGVNVTEPNPDDETLVRYTNYGTTWATIKDRLIDRFDDTAIRLRRNGSAFYLDYVTIQTYGNECEQDVRFGENLLDYSDSLTTDDICSSVVPLGATITDEEGNPSRLGNIIEKRVTIETVNGGKNYVEDSKLVSRFGHVRTTHSWSGVKTPAALKRKAIAWLADGQWEKLSLKLQVADLTLVGEASDSFRVGDRAYVVAEEYGLRKVFPICARTYDLDDPSKDELRLGANVEGSFVKASVASAAYKELEQADSQYVMSDMLKNAIQNVTAMMTGSRGGYKYTEYDDQGRWVADYIMDSMDRNTAKVVKKVNVDGTAYSTNGINGPYTTAMMADGTILGKYIAAHSINAEKLSTEYIKEWNDKFTGMQKSITSLESGPNGIEATYKKFSRDLKTNVAELESKIAINAEGIRLSVRKDNVCSVIEQSPDKIYISANRFGWQSTYSSLSTNGTLRAVNAQFINSTIIGHVTSGIPGSMRLELNAGQLAGYDASNRLCGYIVPGGALRDSSGAYRPSFYLVSRGNLRITATDVAVAATSDPYADHVKCFTGTIPNLVFQGSPSGSFAFKNARFIHGMLVTTF